MITSESLEVSESWDLETLTRIDGNLVPWDFETLKKLEALIDSKITTL